MSQRQLNRLSNLLLLQIHTAHIRIRHIRLLLLPQHRNRRIRLGRQNIHKRIRMTMQRHRGRRFQKLTVQRGQNPNNIVRPRRRPDNPRVLVDRLEELANHERHGLDPLYFLLRTDELAFQVGLFVFDVGFLNVQHVEVTGEFLVFDVIVFFFLELLVESGFLAHDRLECRFL